MEDRIRLAKKLLNPKDSVLIVTIDEKEYIHLELKEGYLNVTIEVPINKDWSEDLSSKEIDFKNLS